MNQNKEFINVEILLLQGLVTSETCEATATRLMVKQHKATDWKYWNEKNVWMSMHR